MKLPNSPVVPTKPSRGLVREGGCTGKYDVIKQLRIRIRDYEL